MSSPAVGRGFKPNNPSLLLDRNHSSLEGCSSFEEDRGNGQSTDPYWPTVMAEAWWCRTLLSTTAGRCQAMGCKGQGVLSLADSIAFVVVPVAKAGSSMQLSF